MQLIHGSGCCTAASDLYGSESIRKLAGNAHAADEKTALENLIKIFLNHNNYRVNKADV